MPVGLDNIIIPNEEVRKRAFEEANQPPPESQGEGKRKWRKGEIEFEALMRHLDNAVSRRGCYWEGQCSEETEDVGGKVNIKRKKWWEGQHRSACQCEGQLCSVSLLWSLDLIIKPALELDIDILRPIHRVFNVDVFVGQMQLADTLATDA